MRFLDDNFMILRLEKSHEVNFANAYKGDNRLGQDWTIGRLRQNVLVIAAWICLLESGHLVYLPIIAASHRSPASIGLVADNRDKNCEFVRREEDHNE